jgi:hypothetical protein
MLQRAQGQRRWRWRKFARPGPVAVFERVRTAIQSAVPLSSKPFGQRFAAAANLAADAGSELWKNGFAPNFQLEGFVYCFKGVATVQVAAPFAFLGPMPAEAMHFQAYTE